MSESVKAPETKAPAKKTQAVTEAKTEAVLYVGTNNQRNRHHRHSLHDNPGGSESSQSGCTNDPEPFHSDQRIRRGRENDQRKERIRIQRLRRSAEIQT